MELLKEINESAKTIEFQIFLEDLKSIDADMKDKRVVDAVHAKMELLKEVGRGDHAAFSGLAKQAGVDPRAADPRVAGALRSPRLNLQPKDSAPPAPKEGETILYQGHRFNPVSVLDDIVILKDRKGNRYKAARAGLKVLKPGFYVSLERPEKYEYPMRREAQG